MLGQVQTPYFTSAESNANEQNPLFSLICIRFGSCEVRRLNLALVQANFVDIYLQGMRDRRMRSGTELAREMKLTDWSMAGNLSNRSSGVQIPRDICTRLKRYLYSAKCSWIIKTPIH